MVACGVSFAATARLATPPDLSAAKAGDSVYMLSPTALLVEQLKQELLLAAEKNDEALGLTVCNKLEKSNLSKEVLEHTRIGGIVNDVRKRVVETAPKFSQKCRMLIKQWRKQTDTYTRAPSSCGGSNGVTPSMMSMSPAMRRLTTPQNRLPDGTSRSQVNSPLLSGITVAGGKGQVASPRIGNGTLVAQAVEKVQREATTAVNNGFTTNASFVIGGKRKLDATSSFDNGSTIKRSKSALISNNVASPQISISGVRQDTQSTAELLAQLSENLPQLLTPDLNLGSKSNSTSPNAPANLKIKIPSQSRLAVSTPSPAFDDRQKRKYTKRAAKFFKDEIESAPPSVADLTKLSTKAPTIEKVKKEKIPAAIPSTSALPTGKPKDKKVDWYAALPSLDALEKMIVEHGQPSKNVRTSYIESVAGHEILYMPFVDIGIPDVIEYGYPAGQCPKMEVPYPRAVRNGLKGL
uniref:TFIIS N-terminal domain-containing protein n=1 Tax=Panagrellus redivivus TaxID=6233 RepID=A0A7E4VCS9_PANRE